MLDLGNDVQLRGADRGLWRKQFILEYCAFGKTGGKTRHATTV